MDISGDGSITLDRRAFKALASETRVEILKHLDGTQKTVSDLARELSMNKATMFQHLEQLVEVGLVKKDSEEDRATTVKEAPNEAPVSGPPKKWVYYRLSWKGKNVLHPERVKIAIMLSLVAVSCLLAALVYAMAFQGPSPTPPAGKDTLPPMVVGWEVDPVRTDSGAVGIRIIVADNSTGKVSGLDENATVLRWGVASDPSLLEPDVVPWAALDRTVQGGSVHASILGVDWSARGGRYLVLSVELRDLAGNSASYRFSGKVAPAAGPELSIVPGGMSFAPWESWSRQYFNLTVQVKNSGQENATGVVVSAFSVDPDAARTGKAGLAFQPAGSSPAIFIGAGKTATVSLVVDSERLASRRLFLMVDPGDAVAEANEADNVLSATVPGNIPVSPAPPTKGADAAPGMELWAVALALAVVAMLARRRMREDRP